MGLGSNQLRTHGCRLERPSILPCVAFASLCTRLFLVPLGLVTLVEREKNCGAYPLRNPLAGTVVHS